MLRALLHKHANAAGLSKKLQCVNFNEEIKMSEKHWVFCEDPFASERFYHKHESGE